MISAQTFGDYATPNKNKHPITGTALVYTALCLTIFGKLGIPTTATLSVIKWQVQEILNPHAANASQHMNL